MEIKTLKVETFTKTTDEGGLVKNEYKGFSIISDRGMVVEVHAIFTNGKPAMFSKYLAVRIGKGAQRTSKMGIMFDTLDEVKQKYKSINDELEFCFGEGGLLQSTFS